MKLTIEINLTADEEPMLIDNINKFCKKQFKALPVLQQHDVIRPFCTCSHGFKKKNEDECAICGGRWKGRPKQNGV